MVFRKSIVVQIFNLLLSTAALADTATTGASQAGSTLEVKARFSGLSRLDASMPFCINLYGGSVEVALFDRVVLEAGANRYGTLHVDSNYDYFLLAGGRYTLLDARRDSSGWKLGLSLSAGYRFYTREPAEFVREDTHAFFAVLGLDASWWFIRNLGIELRLSPFVTVPVSWTGPEYTYMEPETALGAAFTVGIVFGL